MIIFRYLSREVLQTALAVTSVLLLIMMSTHFIGYMEDAAAGDIQTSVVFELLFNRIPFFLELLLPLGLFLGVLLSHGRLYLDSEMVALSAGGVSSWQIIKYTLGPGLLVAGLSAVVSLYLTPAGLKAVKQIEAEQSERADFDMLVPGTFHETKAGDIVYVSEVDETGNLIDVFISGQSVDSGPVITFAPRARQEFVEEQGRYLILSDGFRYQGEPQSTVFDEMSFSEYGLLIDEPYSGSRIGHLDTLSTIELFRRDGAVYTSRLHWRFSLPVIALVVVLLAVPLAKTNPRRGRYAKLIPSILIYQFYIIALTSARSSIENGTSEPWILWSVHTAAVLLSLTFIRFDSFWVRVLSRLPNMSVFLRGQKN